MLKRRIFIRTACKRPRHFSYYFYLLESAAEIILMVALS